MANSHYKRKDYTQLLGELQTKSKKSKSNKLSSVGSDVQEELKCLLDTNSDTEDDVTELKSKPLPILKSVHIDYDLDKFLHATTYLDKLTRIYDDAVSQVEVEQQITQDLLHAIEFANNCKEWYRLSTQLHYSRVRRRQYKNTIEVLRPLIEFSKSPDNKKCLNVLRNIIGESRKVKSHVGDKTYHPRILTELGVFKNGKSSK